VRSDDEHVSEPADISGRLEHRRPTRGKGSRPIRKQIRDAVKKEDLQVVEKITAAEFPAGRERLFNIAINEAWANSRFTFLHRYLGR